MGLKLASESTFRRVVDTILAASKAEYTFINFDDGESSTLRFANNQVVQNVSVRNLDVSVQLAYGRKAGSASTNRLDEESLTTTVRRAETIARLAPDDPEYLPPIGPQKFLDVPSFRASTATVAPGEFAKLAGPVIERCTKRDLTAAGIVSSGVSVQGVAASSGLFGYEQSTWSQFSLTATASDSSGWCCAAHRNINELGIETRTDSAIDKAIRSKDPRELPAGHYPVILEPAAVAGVLQTLFYSLDAKSYYKGDSALAGKLGSQIIDPRLTIRTDPRHPDLLGARFDGRGLPSRDMTWIDRGVLKQLYYDRFTAQEHNVEPTPFAGAPIVDFSGPTVSTIDELVAQTKRAILITNLWYIRFVDPADLTITGMTRDGTFLVEDGKIVGGVKNFRFHDSPLRCFEHVEAATGPLQTVTMESDKMLLPAVRLPDFNLSSVTKF